MRETERGEGGPAGQAEGKAWAPGAEWVLRDTHTDHGRRLQGEARPAVSAGGGGVPDP